MQQVTVVFEVSNRDTFMQWLQVHSGDVGPAAGCPLGYRADDQVQRREALTKFVDRMETVLRAHDSKTSWRDRPLAALIKLLKLELAEFDVAYEFFEISEARKELVDIANYCLIVDDRMSLLEQEKPVRDQT